MASEKLTPQEFERLRATQPIAKDTPLTSSDSSILGHLATVERSLLDAFMTEEHYEPGSVVFREGERGDAMYVIRSGRIAVVKGEPGTATVLSHWGPGAIIGEMALLEDQPRSASIVALDELHLLRISREGFQQLMSSAPDIKQTIMEALSSRLRVYDDIRSASLAAERKLSGRVSELQAERQQLLELQRLRQEANDLIAQDLRVPLDSLRSIVHILEIVLPPETLRPNRELLEAAKLASQRIRQLMDSLRQLSKQWPTPITVLFAEASGLRPLTGEMDAGDITQVMQALWRQLDEIILEHGGLVDRHIGDSAIALWGAEAGSQDKPEQAIRTALAMRDKLATFCQGHKISLSLRIGIHTGPVLLGEAGTTREYAAQGYTVNTARRLGESAPAGGILISHDTYQHVQAAFVVQSEQAVQIEGQLEPIQVYLVKGAKYTA